MEPWRNLAWTVRVAVTVSTAVLLSGCATDPALQNASSPLGEFVSDTARDQQEDFIAANATVKQQGLLHIVVKGGGRQKHINAVLSADEASAISGPLEHFATREPSIVFYTPDGTAAEGISQRADRVSIRSREDWRLLVLALATETAGLVPDSGIVLDVLRQQEIFFYVDTEGEIQAVPLEDKPRSYRPAQTITLTQRLVDDTDRLRRANKNIRYLLFNTGDIPDTGFPLTEARVRSLWEPSGECSGNCSKQSKRRAPELAVS